jgi:hypothetical protein
MQFPEIELLLSNPDPSGTKQYFNSASCSLDGEESIALCNSSMRLKIIDEGSSESPNWVYLNTGYYR